mgnify:CR=1 FL=1
MDGAVPADWRTHLAEVIKQPQLQADRSIFHELNPQIAQAPILKGLDRPVRKAAVLIPILDRPIGPQILLTVRPKTMPTHAGEISFPGGGHQPEDDGMVGTALRETHEEVGVPAEAVSVLGSMGVHNGGRGFAVTPILGIVDGAVPIVPCEREVEEVFEVPLDFLTNTDNHLIETRNTLGTDYRMPAVPYDDGERRWHIWGLTAAILHSLALAYTNGGS